MYLSFDWFAFLRNFKIWLYFKILEEDELDDLLDERIDEIKKQIDKKVESLKFEIDDRRQKLFDKLDEVKNKLQELVRVRVF